MKFILVVLVILLLSISSLSLRISANSIRKNVVKMAMVWKDKAGFNNNMNSNMSNNQNMKSFSQTSSSQPSSSQPSSSQPSSSSKNQGITFASYVIYKGKGAVSVKIITPSFSSIGQSRQVSKAGGLFFEFAPALGQREYDWSRKGTFLLDVTECGTVLSLEKGVSNSYEFVHDPMMGQEGEGQTIKKMKWSTSKDGVFLNLSVTDKNKNTNDAFSVPLSYGEMEVIFSIIKFSIPRFLGFHEVWSNPGMSGGYDNQPLPPAAPVWSNLKD